MKILPFLNVLSRIFLFWKRAPKSPKSAPELATDPDLAPQQPVGVICILTDASPAGFKVIGPCYEDPLCKALAEKDSFATQG